MKGRTWMAAVVIAGLVHGAFAADVPEANLTPSEIELKELSKAAGVEIKQDGIGRVGGRDIDTRDMTPAEIRRIEKACADKGYHVESRGQSLTITKGKHGQALVETTIHRKAGMEDAPGTASAEARSHVNDPEHFNGRIDPETGHKVLDVNGRVDATVADVVGKTATVKGVPVPGEHPLNKDPGKMTRSDLENAAKMTEKAMKIGGVKDPVLQKQIDAIRNGKSPAEAGIDDPAAFQKKCRERVTEAVRNENRQIREARVKLEGELKQAGQELDKARNGNDPDALKKAREKFQDVKGRALKYDTAWNGAQLKAIENGAGDLYAEANEYKKTTTPDGKVRYVDPKTGAPVSKSNMKEAITKGQNANLRMTPLNQGKAATVTKLLSPPAKVTLYGMLIYSGVEAIKRANEILDELGVPDDSYLKRWIQLTSMGVISTLGIERADEIGMDQAAQTTAEWKKDVKAGLITDKGIKGYAWILLYGAKAGVKAALTQTKELAEGMVVTPVVNTYLAAKEGVGAVVDAVKAQGNQSDAARVDRELKEKKEAKEKAEKEKAEKEKAEKEKAEKEKAEKEKAEKEKAEKEKAEKERLLKQKIVKKAPETPVKPTPPPVVKKPAEPPPRKPVAAPAPRPPAPSGYRIVEKGYVYDKKGKIALSEVQDEKGNVIKLIHTTYDAKGNVIDRKESRPETPSAGTEAVPAQKPDWLVGVWKEKSTGLIVYAFKADHTYRAILSGDDGTKLVVTGGWKLTGNKLQMTPGDSYLEDAKGKRSEIGKGWQVELQQGTMTIRREGDVLTLEKGGKPAVFVRKR